MSDRFAPHLALIAVQILFGIWPIFGKVVLRSMSSTSLVTLRITGAALALALLQRRLTPLFRMPVKDIVLLVACSLLGIVGNQFLFVKGLSLTTVINAEILSTTIPVYALTISILLGYERSSVKSIGGMLIAVIGVVYLINPTRADLTTQTTTGNILILINSFLYAIFIVISKSLYERYGALNVITWIFVVGLLVTIPVGIYSLQQENLAAIDATVWMALAFIILLPTVGAYYLNAYALTRVSPSTVAIYIYLQPLMAFGLAPILLGEQWNYRTIVAALLIFIGVAFVTTNKDNRAVHVSASLGG
jgi:drug/metabolite transporter (DMT)-like permease